MMSFVNILLIAMLGILNIQQSQTQLLNVLSNLTDDFLNNFPEATNIQYEENDNLKSNTSLKYIFPVNGSLATSSIPVTNSNVGTSIVTIEGTSFIGNRIKISVKEDRQAVVFGNMLNNQDTIFIPEKETLSGVDLAGKGLAIDAMVLLAGVNPGPNGYTLNDMRIQFVNIDTDIPYNISASDRALGGRIKNWLNNKLPVVVEKYKEYIHNLTTVGILNLTYSLL